MAPVSPLPEAEPDEPPLDAAPAFLEPMAEPIPGATAEAEPEAVPATAEAEPAAGEPDVVVAAGEPEPASGRSLQRLAAAVGHEVRNPLTAVRTFTELLPERFDDPDFRSHFARLAEQSLGQVEQVLGRLEQLATFPAPERRPVDVGALLREVLDKRRSTIHERRLVVLEELDRTDPTALSDPDQLRFAIESLIDGSLALVPERGDVYLASRRHDSGLRGEPSVRVLLRYRGPDEPRHGSVPVGDVSPAANSLAFALADIVVRAQGGTLALDTSDSNETVLVLDLPS
jgi:signal transduction histidine kinase